MTQMIRAWPAISSLSEPTAQVKRRAFIGGSDANIILAGHRDRLLRLWREKRGECEPENITGHLSAMLGCWTEAFNRQWYESVSGMAVERVGERLICDRYRWRRCTLDGFVTAMGAVWEAKHVNAFSKPDDALERYMPQLQHNMAVAGAERAILSVIFGNHRFEVIEVRSDWLYQEELLRAEADFWDCVQTGREPVPATPPVPPRPVGTREVCLEGSNSWASAARDWLQHRAAARSHAAAVALLKELVGDDVSRAFGHGIEAKRNKAGAITIRELV